MPPDQNVFLAMRTFVTQALSQTLWSPLQGHREVVRHAARAARAFPLRSSHSCIFDALATLGATQRARPPKGFEAQSRKGSQGSRGRLKAAATVKSFSSAAPPNLLWHERAVKKIKPGHKT